MKSGSRNKPDRKLFLIAGCQRSGTTLLRLILSSHSQVNCIDEGRVYTMLRSGRMREFVRGTCAGGVWCGFKIPRFTEQLANKLLTDYGLNGVYENFYRQDPILFITRDPRDVVCSMRALRMGDTNWLHKWGKQIIHFWKQHSRQFATTFASELAFAEQSEHRDVAMGAIYWKYKNAAYRQYLDHNFPIRKIRYEELVQDPKNTINRAVSLLHLPWEDRLLAHHEKQHTETDTHGRTIGDTDTRRPISTSSMGRYHSELNPDEVNTILEITSPIAEELGYDMTD